MIVILVVRQRSCIFEVEGCYRLGTLTYPLSFELGVKVIVWREHDRMGFVVPNTCS